MDETTKPVMAIEKIAEALAKAQAKMTNPPKTRGGQHKGGKYLYADLADVLDHVRAPLTEHGLSVVQIVQPEMLITRLVHSSGQFFESLYPLPKHGTMSPQDMGSAITYARRYSLCPLLGIAGETDDDAKGASEADEEKRTAEADQAREEARKRMEEKKGKGQLKSAYTGEVLKPGQEVGPGGETVTQPPTEAAPEVEKPAARVNPNAGLLALNGIDMRLRSLMVQSGITPDQLKQFTVDSKIFPAPGKEPKHLPVDWIEKLIKDENWKRVVEHIKKKGSGK